MKKPRRFSVPGFVLVAGLINAVINAFFGWTAIRPPAVTLPMFGVPSIFGDLIAMSFFIAFATSLFVTRQVRGQVERGELIPPQYTERSIASYAKWPDGKWRRALLCGAVSVAVFVPVPLMVLVGTGVEHFDKVQLTQFKAVFSFVEGGIVTPLIALAALAFRPAPAATAAQ